MVVTAVKVQVKWNVIWGTPLFVYHYKVWQVFPNSSGISATLVGNQVIKCHQKSKKVNSGKFHLEEKG